MSNSSERMNYSGDEWDSLTDTGVVIVGTRNFMKQSVTQPRPEPGSLLVCVGMHLHCACVCATVSLAQRAGQ